VEIETGIKNVFHSFINLGRPIQLYIPSLKHTKQEIWEFFWGVGASLGGKYFNLK